MKTRTLISMLFFLLSALLSGQSVGNEVRIKIITEMGDIHAIIDLKNAPVTSNNFLRYVDAGLFDSASFYRVVRPDNQPDNPVKIEVIQGGRNEKEDKGFPPILHETTNVTGINHRDGTISMARNNPGSSTSEFFICVGDQPELDYGGRRNPDGQGFAAFGKVTKGKDVVMRIQNIKSTGQYLEKPVLIISIKRE